MKEQKSHSRRKILKTATIAGVAVTSEIVLPGGWVKPVAEFFVSPAHAQTSAPPEALPPEEVPPLDGPDTPSSPAPAPPGPTPVPPGLVGTTYHGIISINGTDDSGSTTAPVTVSLPTNTCVTIQDGSFDVVVRINSSNGLTRYEGSGTGPAITLRRTTGLGPATGRAQVSFTASSDDLFVGLSIGYLTGSDNIRQGAC